jgi:DNA-binding Lrp family transcriptional regulator
MDNLDRKIIHLLEQNSRLAFLAIANELDVTEGTIRQRVKKLKDKGIITKFTINHIKGYSAILNIDVDSKISVNKIIKQIKELDIDSIYEVVGNINLVCFIKQNTSQDIDKLMYEIKRIKGIGDIKLYPVIKEV